MSWDQIIGQGPIKDLLRKGLKSRRVAHAYLFSGPEGAGKYAVALQLARALNCTTDPVEGCGSCAGCRKIDRLQHPDVRLIFPLPVGKGEKSGDHPIEVLASDALEAVREELARKADDPYHRIAVPRANFIKINSIRDIRRQASLSQVEGGTKVFIILEAHNMNAESSNALLKTLEEPPADTVLILTTSQRDRLLPTILSRCQVINFPPLREEEISAALQERENVPPDEAAVAARLANGSYLAAREALSADTVALRDEVVQFLRRALGQRRQQLAAEIERLASELDRPAAERWLRSMQAWFRDALLLRNEGSERMGHLPNRDDLASFVAKFPDADLSSAARIVDEFVALLGKNVYLTLLFTALALRLRDCLTSALVPHSHS